MTYIVQYSGGIGSFGAAKILVDLYGSDNVDLLFADTKTEDEDLYRFLDETKELLGCELHRIVDGRNVWEVFQDKRYIGNSRIDPCSRILKREPLRKYINENYDPEQDIVVLGIDWTEAHRLEKAKPKWEPWTVIAPLTERVDVNKKTIFGWLEEAGIKKPRLYEMGFPHNNCGGFCVKAGQAQFKMLAEHMPERFDYHAEQEQKMRELLDRDVSILRRQEKGERRTLTLYELKQEIADKKDNTDPFDFGGCGCAID